MNGELREMWDGGLKTSGVGSADDTHTNSRDTHGESQALL
jgi:hypothetical protein